MKTFDKESFSKECTNHIYLKDKDIIGYYPEEYYYCFVHDAFDPNNELMTKCFKVRKDAVQRFVKETCTENYGSDNKYSYQQIDDDSTVKVRMCYDPVNTRCGHKLSYLFCNIPDADIRDNNVTVQFYKDHVHSIKSDDVLCRVVTEATESSVTLPIVETNYTHTVPDILKIDSDAVLHVSGNVECEQILVGSNCDNLLITGDGSLTVRNPQRNISIGVPIVRDLSYGRYYMPKHTFGIVIDIPEIHTSSAISGAGIGTLGVDAITGDCFTDTCVVRDTPVDMVIYNKPISGTTKHSADPEYYTKDAWEQQNSESHNTLHNQLLVHKSVDTLFSLFDDLCKAFLSSEKSVVDAACISLIDTLSKVSMSMTVDNFAEGLQRIYGSLFKALLENTTVQPDIPQLLDFLPYVMVKRELTLFDKVAKLPLSFRYHLILRDACMNNYIETKDVNNMSSFDELFLTPELLKHYKHPTDMSYQKKCYRSLYGFAYYDLTEDLNTLVESEYNFSDKHLESSVNLYLPLNFYETSAGYINNNRYVICFTTDSDNCIYPQVVSPNQNIPGRTVAITSLEVGEHLLQTLID